jgi:hypothetical protein
MKNIFDKNIFIANEMELVQSRKLENVPIMSSCPLYRGYNYMLYSLMDNMRLYFIDSDLSNRGDL